jgi:hypothetical protein
MEVALFEIPDLYMFPQLCLSVGSASPGACLYIPDSNDSDPWLEDGDVESG